MKSALDCVVLELGGDIVMRTRVSSQPVREDLNAAQDDPRWHSADSDRYESEGEGERYEFGQECLDRMALALGGNTVVPLASAYLPALLADADWRKRHAALICLAQIAEGCVTVMAKNVSGLVDMCLQVRLGVAFVQRLATEQVADGLKATVILVCRLLFYLQGSRTWHLELNV